MRDATGPDGALSSTVPFAKHLPPVDPTWPTAYPQLVRLMWLYNADRRCIEKHMPTLKRYVDYVGQVRSCPSCRAPTNKQTQTSGGLPIFYMNGDWMEARPQSEELLLSGPPLAALHYIIDLEIVAELSAVLGLLYFVVRRVLFDGLAREVPRLAVSAGAMANGNHDGNAHIALG